MAVPTISSGWAGLRTSIILGPPVHFPPINILTCCSDMLDTSTNCKLTVLGITQADGQIPKLTDQLSYEINGRLVDQPALCIKLRLGVCYVDMRCIHGNHIQRDADVTEVKLTPCSAKRTHRRAEHCAGLAVCW